jgi:hypothetical protein
LGQCSALKPNGERCRLIAMRDSDRCWTHDPSFREARKRNSTMAGKTGGRGRPSEIGQIKEKLSKIATDVLDPESDVGRGEAAVAIQAYSAIMNCIRTELKRREQEDLIQRLEGLEAALSSGRKGSGIVLRTALKRVEKAAEGEVDWFATKDGRRFIYNPQRIGEELFVFACASLRDAYLPDEPAPEEPEFLEAVRHAANPEEVIARFQCGFVNVHDMVYGESSSEE